MGKPSDHLDGIFGKGTFVKGEIRTEGSLRIDGIIEGNVSATETVITGKDSVIKGDVHCKDAVLAGRVEGNLFVVNVVELLSGANLFGDVSCKNLIIQKDAFFQGKCQMIKEEKRNSP